MKRGKAKGGCLVVCSGGLDSTVALYDALANYATCLVGDRFSNICRFECVKGKWTMTQKHLYGKRCKDVAKLRQFNFNQWVRFQEYAETHL